MSIKYHKNRNIPSEFKIEQWNLNQIETEDFDKIKEFFALN